MGSEGTGGTFIEGTTSSSMTCGALVLKLGCVRGGEDANNCLGEAGQDCLLACHAMDGPRPKLVRGTRCGAP